MKKSVEETKTETRVQKYSKTKKGLTARIYSNQKRHSIARGHRMPEYTGEELREWLFSQELFHELYSEWVNSGYEKRLIPSVDRKEDSIHYCMSNIQLMTWGENYDKGTISRHKKVKCFTKEGELLHTYSSIAEASEMTGTRRKSISECVRKNYHTANGFVWRYENG